LGTTETQVVHIAQSKLADETLAAYEVDDGPLIAAQLAKVAQPPDRRAPGQGAGQTKPSFESPAPWVHHPPEI